MKTTQCAAIILGLGFLPLVALPASAQMGGQGRRGGANQSTPNHSGSTDATGKKGLGPEERDAIDLFSRLCVSTRGDHARAIAMVGENDSAVEKMDAPTLRGLENGASGGMGWIIRMPFGEKLVAELPANGACIVRAPRITPAQLEGAFQNLLDQYGASDQFKARLVGDQIKTIDVGPQAPDDPLKPNEKLKYHIVTYNMALPGSDSIAELGLADTESKSVAIQATLSFEILPAKH